MQRSLRCAALALLLAAFTLAPGALCAQDAGPGDGAASTASPSVRIGQAPASLGPEGSTAVKFTAQPAPMPTSAQLSRYRSALADSPAEYPAESPTRTPLVTHHARLKAKIKPARVEALVQVAPDPTPPSDLTAPPAEAAAASPAGDELQTFAAPPLERSGRPLPHAPITILVLGDSIAFGEGASDPRLGFAFDVFDHLAIKRPGSTVVNHAIPGSRIADISRLEMNNLPAHADLLLIEAGSNDVVHDGSPSAVANSMSNLLHRVKTRYPHAAIIICGIPDLAISPFFVGKAHHDVAVAAQADNTALKSVAQSEQVNFADVYGLTQKLRKKASVFLGADEFHPSDSGHMAIAKLIDPVVKSALSPR